jgi:RNA polymerase sigma factor (sigma-70 family)
MDGARPRAAPSGIAPGRTERAADHAVTVLYRSHYAALVRETALLVGDFATAEDVVQDCFIALHRAWWRVRDTSAAQFYLRRSMINKSRSVLRRRVVADRHPVISEPALPSAEESALAVVQVSLVRAALSALPVRQREVLVLRYYADLSETQIAAVMGSAEDPSKSTPPGPETPSGQRSRTQGYSSDRTINEDQFPPAATWHTGTARRRARDRGARLNGARTGPSH